MTNTLKDHPALIIGTFALGLAAVIINGENVRSNIYKNGKDEGLAELKLQIDAVKSIRDMDLPQLRKDLEAATQSLNAATKGLAAASASSESMMYNSNVYFTQASAMDVLQRKFVDLEAQLGSVTANWRQSSDAARACFKTQSTVERQEKFLFPLQPH